MQTSATNGEVFDGSRVGSNAEMSNGSPCEGTATKPNRVWMHFIHDGNVVTTSTNLCAPISRRLDNIDRVLAVRRL